MRVEAARRLCEACEQSTRLARLGAAHSLTLGGGQAGRRVEDGGEGKLPQLQVFVLERVGGVSVRGPPPAPWLLAHAVRVSARLLLQLPVRGRLHPRACVTLRVLSGKGVAGGGGAEERQRRAKSEWARLAWDSSQRTSLPAARAPAPACAAAAARRRPAGGQRGRVRRGRGLGLRKQRRQKQHATPPSSVTASRGVHARTRTAGSLGTPPMRRPTSSSTVKSKQLSAALRAATRVGLPGFSDTMTTSSSCELAKACARRRAAAGAGAAAPPFAAPHSSSLSSVRSTTSASLMRARLAGGGDAAATPAALRLPARPKRGLASPAAPTPPPEAGCDIAHPNAAHLHSSMTG